MPYIVSYFIKLRITFHDAAGLTGFVLFLSLYSQTATGLMLCFSYVTESMNVPLSSDEEDIEVRHIDDAFFLHESGVDVIQFFLFVHLLSNLFLNVVDFEQEFAWNTGVILFLIIQVVVFSGLVLGCNHLSDITLLVASNIFHTFCFFIGNIYWLFFTDNSLNTDTVTSLAYLHFSLGTFVTFFAVYHGIDMHYDWNTDEEFTSINQEIDWFDEALVSEVSQTIEFLLMLFFVCLLLYSHPETLSYELFTWGDVGMITDIRFYGVAPHWYFSPYMSWLLVCPFHYTGIFGVFAFFIVLYFQPNIVGSGEFDSYNTSSNALVNFFTGISLVSSSFSFYLSTFPGYEYFYFYNYVVFLVSIWYSFSYLPYGSFFNRIGGNDATICAYTYIFIYLSCPILRSPAISSLSNSLVY